MAEFQSPLRIGFLGAGFIAHFHLRAFEGVRDVQISGVYSPTSSHREALAAEANERGLGPCRVHDSLEALITADDIDALWILGPNDTRLEHMRFLQAAVASGASHIRAVACEKPLARNLGEAREMLRLADEAGLNHGYLENMIFSTGVQRGKEIVWRRGVPNAGPPYLARAAEEHSGPHAPWFWHGERQGGGVVLDMMCHSVEVCRWLLTTPGATRGSLRPRKVTGTIASLKWTQPAYQDRLRATMGTEVDFANRPSEDFGRSLIVLEDQDGREVLIETTTSWVYVGAGLRTQIELLGPEYSMELNTLNTGLKVFFSRRISGGDGEDLVEKQNAEQGLMPVVEDEAGVYGYTLENRHMVQSFRRGVAPIETFADGVAVIELLMAVYRSAELGRTLELPDLELETYIPPVARSH